MRRKLPPVLKIVHVVHSLDVGGLERLVIDLVREGNRFGNQTVVVCVEEAGDLAGEAEALGARVYCVDKPPGLRPKTVKDIARVLHKIAPQVVHTHQIGALFYAGPAARRLGKKGGRYAIETGAPAVVHTEHGKHYSRRRTRWLGRIAGRYAERFCCVSADIAEDVRAARIVRGDKIVVVPNGVDVGRFAHRSHHAPRDCNDKPVAGFHHAERDGYYNLKLALGIPPQAPVVGTVGRLTEIKRQEVLLKAFARAGELQIANCKLQIANWTRERDGTAERACDVTLPHLVIVGDGPLRGELERLAGELGIAERVHFVGYQAEPERYLAILDVFALTSRSEGMPLSILEAWAAGVPVVASAVGGVPELVVEGETGLLFAAEDVPAAAGAMTRLLAEPHVAARLAAAGRERVEREYSLSRTAETYQRLYRDLYMRQHAIEGQP